MNKKASTLIFVLLLFWLVTGYKLYTLYNHVHNNVQEYKVKIIKSTRENNLTSIVYTVGSDTLALDYLTDKELDSIKNLK